MFEIRCDDRFDFGSSEYSGLFEGADATQFQHPAWLQAMHEKLVPVSGVKQATLVITCLDTGELAAVLPLIRTKSGPLRLIQFCNLDVVDHASAVIRGSVKGKLMAWPDLARSVLKALGEFDLLWIKHVREQNKEIAAFFGDAVQVRPACFSSHATILAGDYASWAQEKLSANSRKSIRRKRKKLAGEGTVEFATLTDPKRIEEAFLFLKKVRQDRFAGEEGQDLLQKDEYLDFYTSIAQEGAAFGLCRTNALKLDNQLIAVTFGLYGNKKYVDLLPGTDFENFGALSPGNVIIDYMLEANFEAGTEVFDLSVGDEAYKLSFGTEAEPIYTICLGRTIMGRFALKAILAYKSFKLNVKKKHP